MKCSLCHYVSSPDGPTHNARSCPLRQTQCRRSLPEGHPFRQLGQCVSALCVHKEKCNTCGVTGHLYGTQALHPGRWKINKNGRLVRKPNKQPLSTDDFVCPMMTDLSIKSMVENTVSVSTTAAEDAHTRRMATSRLHANTNAERLDIDETVRVMEGLGSNAALLQEENKASFKTLYSNAHLGAVAANRLAASAAESSLDDGTPPSTDDDGMLGTSEEEAAASAAGARAGGRKGLKPRTARGGGVKARRQGGDRGGNGGGSGSGNGGGNGGGNANEHDSGNGGTRRRKESRDGVAGKAARTHHAGRQSRTDRYAAAIAKSQSQRPSPATSRSKKLGGGKAKASRSNNGGASSAPIDVDGLVDTQSGLARDDGWPDKTRARFERTLPSFVSPRFGGTPPVRIAHAVLEVLYQCPVQDVDADIAGVVIKGALDSQVRGFMLTSGTLSSAQVAEWLCSAMPSALRRASLPSIACAVQSVVDTAASAAAASAVAGRVGAVAVASPTTKARRGPAVASRAESTTPSVGTPADAGDAPPAAATMYSPAFRPGARPTAGSPASRAAATPAEHVAVVAPPTSVASVAAADSVAPTAPVGASGTTLAPLVAVAQLLSASAPELSPMAAAAAAAAEVPSSSTLTDV